MLPRGCWRFWEISPRTQNASNDPSSSAADVSPPLTSLWGCITSIGEAVRHYRGGLRVKPLMPNVWFRLGTAAMRLEEWDLALSSFTEVVRQEPEEGDAWANVAAVYMRRRDPAGAYPALVEVRIGTEGTLFLKLKISPLQLFQPPSPSHHSFVFLFPHTQPP